MLATPDDPHAGQPVLSAGAPLAEARAAVVALHGRGAGAADILGLSQAMARSRGEERLRRDRESKGDIAWLAPEAAGRAWYPNPFMTPVAGNEPYLSSALGIVAALLAHLAEAGVPAERVALLGFSQGACLASEFAARNPRRYGGLIVFSGGLIGDAVDPAAYTGSLAGTPAFVGCSDVDPYIPLPRVRESVAVLRALGAEVTEQVYPRAGHAVLADEVDEARRILDAIAP